MRAVLPSDAHKAKPSEPMPPLQGMGTRTFIIRNIVFGACIATGHAPVGMLIHYLSGISAPGSDTSTIWGA